MGSDDVAQRPADQDQRSQGQQVRVRYPLLPGQAAAEFRPDGGQRHVDGGGVQPGDKGTLYRGEQRDSLSPAASRLRQPCQRTRAPGVVPSGSPGVVRDCSHPWPQVVLIRPPSMM
jgi:hypothetical protein